MSLPSVPSLPDLPKPGRKAKIFGTIAVVLVVLVFLLPVLVSNYTELKWFQSVDMPKVYWGVIITRIILFFVFALVAGAIVWGAAFDAYRSADKSP